MEITGWPARIIALAFAVLAVFLIPKGIAEITREHHYYVIVPVTAWVVFTAALLFGTWFRTGSWPSRSK